MRTITLSPKARSKNGSVGMYFRYSKTEGVKVAFCYFCSRKKRSQCKDCRRGVRREHRALVVAWSVRGVLPIRTPEPRGLAAVLGLSRPLLGVAMEHIIGRDANDHEMNEMLEVAEDYFPDEHSGNYIVTKAGVLYRVDLGSTKIEPRLRRLAHAARRRT